MKFSKASASATTRFFQLDQIFYNDDIFGVLEGSAVLGTVSRKSVKSVRLENRPSFKHPLAGAIVGVVMLGVPVQSLLGDPLNIRVIVLGSCLGLWSSVFLVLMGAYLLWGVLRRRQIPWLIFETGSRERTFALKHELTAQEVAVLESAFGVIQATRGFPVQQRSPDGPV